MIDADTLKGRVRILSTITSNSILKNAKFSDYLTDDFFDFECLRRRIQ